MSLPIFPLPARLACRWSDVVELIERLRTPWCVFVNAGFAPFQIPRYHWPREVTLVRRYSTGLERIRQIVFGGA